MATYCRYALRGVELLCNRAHGAPDGLPNTMRAPRGGRPPLPLPAPEDQHLKTYVATPATRERNWLVVDATGKTLGRLATQIADALRGKRKPEFTPHCDVGDFVIVVNAEKITVTGN